VRDVLGPTALAHPVEWLRAHPLAADILLALGIGIPGLIGMLTIDQESSTSTNRDADLLGIVLVVALWGTVALRRRYPELSVQAGTVLIAAFWILDYVDAGTSLAILVLVYTLAAHVDRPRSLRIGLVVGAVLVAVMSAGVASEEEGLPLIAVVANAIIFATAWTIGDSVRSRQAYLAEVEARADRAERDREAAAVQAVEDERARIARELHDVVAHSVSVMVVQAGAARRVLERNPDQTAESLSVIEATARDALDELRRLLGVLRAEHAPAAVVPQPRADDVTTLVEQWRDAGLDVHLEVEGPRLDLAPGVSLTVYRLVQEALTNVMKHAGPARAEVRIRHVPAEVMIEVTDDGRGPLCDPDLPSAGQGLIGMRERVELFGGQLEVGPRPGGGFRVRAHLPLVPAATP